MDHRSILQDLDSLWFFSNVLSPSPLSFRTAAASITKLKKASQSPTSSCKEAEDHSGKERKASNEESAKRHSVEQFEKRSSCEESEGVKGTPKFSQAARDFVEQVGQQSSGEESQGVTRMQRLAEAKRNFDEHLGQQSSRKESQDAMRAQQFAEAKSHIVEQVGQQSRGKELEGMNRRQRLFAEEKMNKAKELVEAWLEGGLELSATWKNKYNGRRRFRDWQMPPLSDDIAMKQHLMSWAHAVACTVR